MQASVLVTGTFAVLSVFLAVLLVLGVVRAGNQLGEAPARTRRWALATAFGLIVWMSATRLLAASGKLSQFDVLPPPLFRLLFVAVLINATLVFSRFGQRLVAGLPLWSLIAFQAFRVPVELALLRAYQEGVLPKQMTFEGWNFDVVSGLSAIVVAWLAARGKLSRVVLLGWNVVSLGLLLVVVTMAILSAPVPFRVFLNDPSTAAVTTPGLIWLPTVLVSAALFGHLLVFRWAAQKRAVASPARRGERIVPAASRA